MKNIMNETDSGINELYDFINNNELGYYKKLYNESIKENTNIRKIKDYEKIVKEIADNIKAIALPDNSISYSYLFFLFLYTGLLSKNELNKKDNKTYTDKVGYLGLDVIKGEACCRHVASLHEDVFKALECKSTIISTTTNQNINSEFPKNANHVINLLEYNKVLYAHDALNGMFYYFVSPLILKNYSIKTPIEFKYQMYKPIIDIKVWGKDEVEIVNNMKQIKETNPEKYLTELELNEIIEATKARFYGSYEELEKYKSKARFLFFKVSSNIFN